MSFDSLNLKPWLVGSLKSLKIASPTPIQVHCIPPALAGRDIIGCAETGSGKTLAFGLPILNVLSDDPYGVCALILTPARELAVQIAEQLRAVGRPMNLNVCVVIGGLSHLDQASALEKNPHIVVATPGRCAQLASQGILRLRKLSFLVLDEADRLISLGFEPELKEILGKCAKKRQTMLFSATMTSTLRVLEGMSLRDPFRWNQHGALPAGPAAQTLATASTLREEFILVPEQVKDAYVVYLARTYAASDVSMILFCPSVEETGIIAHMLKHLMETPVAELHSLLPQRERIDSLNEFRNGRARVLVASDVAARGLDIPITDLVINVGVPRDTASYVHRVGRTARAGRQGVAISIVSQDEVSQLLNIEEGIGHKLEAHPVKEDSVLKFLREAKAARQVATLWWKEMGLAEKDEARKVAVKGRSRQKKKAKKQHE